MNEFCDICQQERGQVAVVDGLKVCYLHTREDDGSHDAARDRADFQMRVARANRWLNYEIENWYGE
jgi:hypothetical protein